MLYHDNKKINLEGKSGISKVVNDRLELTIKELLGLDPKDKLEEKKAKNKQKRNSGYSANFESWWKVYPKKRNKPGVWKAWKANLTNLASIERMLHNLDIQSKSWDWTQEGGQYIPYPASYLNAHGWNDNLQASPAAAPKSRQQTEHDRQMQIIADGLKDDEPEPKIIECEVR